MVGSAEEGPLEEVRMLKVGLENALADIHSSPAISSGKRHRDSKDEKK